MSLFIKCLPGLGDHILQRPFVRAAVRQYDDVYLETPWPDLYSDLPLRFCRPGSGMRTQAKNIARQSCFVAPPKNPSRSVFVTYLGNDMTGSYQSSMEIALPLGDIEYAFDLPKYDLPDIAFKRPLAIIRPVTLRSESRIASVARNPLPEYIEQIAARLMATHYFVVVLADLADNKEWIVGNCPPHHLAFLHGELPLTSLMALVEAADICVGGVGWLTVAAIAYQRPVFTILGGMGKLNSVERITDQRMDLRNAAFAVPENFCQCMNPQHNCDKRIPNLERLFLDWFNAMQQRQSVTIVA